MPTTFALVAPTTADLDLKIKEVTPANKPLIDVVSMTTDGDGNASADYIYNAGAGRDVISVGVRRNYDKKRDKTSCSIRLKTVVRETVSETGVVTDHEVETVLAWNYAGRFAADTASVATLIQILIGLYVNSTLTAANGFPTAAMVDTLDRGAITGIWG